MEEVCITCDYHLPEFAVYLRGVRNVNATDSLTVAVQDDKDVRALDGFLNQPSPMALRKLSILSTQRMLAFVLLTF